jgi:hypothetical protein
MSRGHDSVVTGGEGRKTLIAFGVVKLFDRLVDDFALVAGWTRHRAIRGQCAPEASHGN